MPRRTQAERTESTRRTLVDATLDLLDERGWAATTAVAVCERAGVTRGALVHHYGGLPALLADALDAQYATLAEHVPFDSPPGSLAESIEATWAVMTTDRFKVVLEAWLAAGNDPEVAETTAPVVERFAKLVGPNAWPTALPDEASRAFYLMARETLFGLALGRATSRGPLGHEQLVLDQLLALARTHDETRPTHRPGDTS